MRRDLGESGVLSQCSRSPRSSLICVFISILITAVKALLLWSHFTDEEDEAGRLHGYFKDQGWNWKWVCWLQGLSFAPLRCTAPDVDMGHELPGTCRPGSPSFLPACPPRSALASSVSI